MLPVSASRTCSVASTHLVEEPLARLVPHLSERVACTQAGPRINLLDKPKKDTPAEAEIQQVMGVPPHNLGCH